MKSYEYFTDLGGFDFFFFLYCKENSFTPFLLLFQFIVSWESTLIVVPIQVEKQLRCIL